MQSIYVCLHRDEYRAAMTPTATAVLTSANWQPPFVLTADMLTGLCAGVLLTVLGLVTIVVMSARRR